MKSLTPKKVALAIGVSESSMKRWCDRGLIATTRTGGGHRRLTKSSVIRFLRDHEHNLIDPTLLGLPERIAPANQSKEEAAQVLYEYLTKADLSSAKSVVFEQYLSGRTLGEAFDEVIAPAFSRIGDKWECGEIEVYHERRSCEICVSLLQELAEFLPAPSENAPIAMGGAPEHDAYSVPSLMAELVLRENGWRTERLGSHIPFSSFGKAAAEFNPKLTWLSVSHVADVESFLQQYNSFVDQLGPDAWIVVGGRALNEDIRTRMKFSAYCEDMRQFEAFAQKAWPRPTNIVEHAANGTASDASAEDSNNHSSSA